MLDIDENVLIVKNYLPYNKLTDPLKILIRKYVFLWLTASLGACQYSTCHKIECHWASFRQYSPHKSDLAITFK